MKRDDFLDVKSSELILYHILTKKFEDLSISKLADLAKKLRVAGRYHWKHQNTFARKIARKMAAEWSVYNVFLCENT